MHGQTYVKYPFDFWPSCKSNAQSQKYWKPKTVDSHSVSPYDVNSGKYGQQWASYWASFDRTALTDDIVARVLWHYYRALSSKKGPGEKTLHFGAICDKPRHMYGLCIKTSNPADLRMGTFALRVYGDALHKPASGLSLCRYELPEKSKTIWNRLCGIQTAANNLHCNVSISYFKKRFLRKICCSLIHE